MNPIVSVFDVDIGKPTVNIMHAKQGESLSRAVSLRLVAGKTPWKGLPTGDNVEYWVQYAKPDGTGGLYSLMPDEETPAVTPNPTQTQDILKLTLAPQVTTCAGNVHLSVSVVDGNQIFRTFSILIIVEAAENVETTSDNYFNCPTLENIVRTIGNLASLNTTDKSSTVAAINELFGKIGTVSNLDTTNKNNLVTAINEVLAAAKAAGTPVATATPATEGADDYVATGDDLPVVQKGDSEQHVRPVGKGRQVIFIPTRKNLTATPSLKLNNGEAVTIKTRSSANQGDNDLKPYAAVSIPVGALQRGVPYQLTFCGKYWMIDSLIGSNGSATGGYIKTINGKEPGIGGDFHLEAEDLPGVQELPIVTSADAVANADNDNAVLTPAAAKAIAQEYGGGGTSHIRIFTLDDVTTAEIAALTEDTDNALFLAYNVSYYTPDPEAETVVYPYENKLLLLPMTGCKLSPLGNYLQATFEQDADLVTYTAETPPVAVTVRKTVRVTVQSGASAGDPDVKTVEIVPFSHLNALILHATYDAGTTSYSLDEGTDGQGNAVDIATMLHDAAANDVPVFVRPSTSNALLELSGLDESPGNNTWVATFVSNRAKAAGSGGDMGLETATFRIRYYKATGLYRDCLYSTGVEPLLAAPITVGGVVCYTASQAITQILAGA